jgi:release factor glutamine methyltransferase
VLDLGTGTGCLLLAFLRERPGWFGIGVDLSPAAAALAARNARKAGVADRAGFFAGSWGEAVARGFDLVLSNPPYIPRADIAGLAPEVRDWEPARALDGGADGFDAYRLMLADLPRLLAPHGVGVLELGLGQASYVTEIAAGAGLGVVEARRDLAGIERALVVRLPG